MMQWFSQQYCRHLAMGIVFILYISFSIIPTIYAQELQWKVFGHLQESRVGFCAAAIGYGKVLVMGGFTRQGGIQNQRLRGEVSRSCEFINVSARSIAPVPPMNVPHADAVILQTKDSNVVVVSGLTTDSTTTPICELYDRQKNEWRVIGSLLIGRHLHSAAFLNNEEIIIVGGIGRFNYGAAIAEAEILNIRTGRSRFIDDFPDKSCFGTSMRSTLSTEEHPIFWGGRGESNISHYISNLYYFNTNSSHWVRFGAFPEALCAVSTLRLFDGRIVVSGGRRKDNVLFDNRYTQSSNLYLEDGSAFVSIGSMLVSRSGHTVNQWSDDILLIISGGSNMSWTPTATTEWFDLRTHQAIEGPLMKEARNPCTSVSFPIFDNYKQQQGACILAIGGADGQGRSLSSVEILETTNPQLLEVPNPEIASQRLKKLLTSPTVIATLAIFILVLIAALLYLLYQVFLIKQKATLPVWGKEMPEVKG